MGASTSGSEGPSELNSGPAGSDVAEKRSQNEGYYCANFKEVLSKSLLSANPERHVITEQEVALVEEFMQLEGGWSQGIRTDLLCQIVLVGMSIQ